MTSRIVQRHKRPSAESSQPQSLNYPLHPASQAMLTMFGAAALTYIVIVSSPLLELIGEIDRAHLDTGFMLFAGVLYCAAIVVLFMMDVLLTQVVASHVLGGRGKIEHLAYRSALPSALILIGFVGMLWLITYKGGGRLSGIVGEFFILLPFGLVGLYGKAISEALQIRESAGMGIAFSKAVVLVAIGVLCVWSALGSMV